MTKRLARIVALVEIEAGSENDAMTIGGNLARQLQGAIPTQYNVRGVEVEGITDVNTQDFAATTSDATKEDNSVPETNLDKDTNVRAQRRAASEKEAEEKTLRT